LPTEVFSRRFTGSCGVPLTIQKGWFAIGALARALPLTSATAYLDLVVYGATACGAIFAAFHARHAMCLHVEPRFEANKEDYSLQENLRKYSQRRRKRTATTQDLMGDLIASLSWGTVMRFGTHDLVSYI
jgi:hypothetical protein